MKQLTLILFLIFLSYANAQNDSFSDKSFDELIKLSKNSQNDSIALAYALQAKGVAKVNANNEQLTRAYYAIAKYQDNLEKNSVALKNIDLALLQVASLKDSIFWYNCLFLKGNILSDLGEDSKALITYLEAKEFAKNLGPVYEIAFLQNIAYIKKIHKDFQEAISLYKSLLSRLNTLEEDKNTAYYRLNALINITDAYLRLKNPDEAEFYNKAGLNEYSDKVKSGDYYTLLMLKAIIEYQKEHYEKCISISKQVRDATKIKNERLYPTALLYLGKSSYMLNAYEEAINYLENAYDKINSLGTIDLNEKELHEYLALAYNKNENLEKAIFHYQKYSALEKKQSIEDLKINNETHALLDVLPLTKEINKLGEALTKQQEKKQNLFILLIGLVMLFLASMSYYILKGKHTKKKFKELLKKVTELENDQEKKIAIRRDQVSDEKARIILKKIANFEKKEYYLLLECSLGFMAEKFETNTTHLSKVINAYKEKSFTAYITELRINTALIRLKNDKTLQSYTIKAIAEEFGFKRQETFSRAFKAHTGMYPSEYLKNLRKEY
jgi:AraC-like DNA-binding protein